MGRADHGHLTARLVVGALPSCASMPNGREAVALLRVRTDAEGSDVPAREPRLGSARKIAKKCCV